MKKYLTTRTFTLMLLGVAGASIGAFIFLFNWQATEEIREFVKSPEFVIWIFINVVLFAFYPILIALLWKPLNDLRIYFFKNKCEIIISALIFTALFFIPIMIGPKIANIEPLPLVGANTKILIVTIIGFLVSTLPLAIGIWLVQAAIRETFGEIKKSQELINQYITYRDYLHQFLMILGSLLSLFILVTAAFRAVLIASCSTNTNEYPTIYLLIIGAYYTLLLALLYSPAYISLIAAGRRLLDAYFALPAPDSTSWASIRSKRKELEDLLDLKVTGEQRFLSSITILSPFVSSIFAFLVEN
jgi:hypothetical protein